MEAVDKADQGRRASTAHVSASKSFHENHTGINEFHSVNLISVNDASSAEKAGQGALPPYHFRGLAATRRSKRKVWVRLVGRWLVTVVFIVCVYAVLIGYSTRDVLSKEQKRQFSAIETGFLIALALITESHLVLMIFDLRWWILSQRARSRRKVRHGEVER